jgi:hypothetical protein
MEAPISGARDTVRTAGYRGTTCVWEFDAVAHEHLALDGYPRSAQDEAAKRAYLESQASGPF